MTTAQSALAESNDDPATGVRARIPSLVTLGSVLSASSAAMLLVAAPSTPARDAAVAFLLGCSMLCDRFDGYIARKLNATSEFGAQLDSIADVVAFGLLPALWIVGRHIGNLGAIATGLAYIVCAAVRLARFHHVGLVHGRFGLSFVGMPTPAAAALVLTGVAASTVFFSGNVVVEAAVLAVAAVWMVAPVHYPKGASSPGVLPFMVSVPLSFAALAAVALR